jgi:hopanoid biosynthesis associated protein HpnK
MQRLAIVNGDDFGLSAGVNTGIIRAHREGILTSASLMATGDAFDEAVALAQCHPGLSTGIHLVLVEGRPVSPPERIPSLVSPDGTFWASPGVFMTRWLTGRIHLGDVEREWAAQVEKVLAHGLRVERLDSHMHLHLLPGIFPLVVALAKRYQIRGIRLPREWTGNGLPAVPIPTLLKRVILSSLAAIHRRRVSSTDLVCPDRFRGITESGRLTEQQLLHILATLKAGVTEIMAHPGYRDAVLDAWPRSRLYAREAELEALVSPAVKAFVTTSNIRLIGFADLGTLSNAAKPDVRSV